MQLSSQKAPKAFWHVHTVARGPQYAGFSGERRSHAKSRSVCPNPRIQLCRSRRTRTSQPQDSRSAIWTGASSVFSCLINIAARVLSDFRRFGSAILALGDRTPKRKLNRANAAMPIGVQGARRSNSETVADDTRAQCFQSSVVGYRPLLPIVSPLRRNAVPPLRRFFDVGLLRWPRSSGKAPKDRWPRKPPERGVPLVFENARGHWIVGARSSQAWHPARFFSRRKFGRVEQFSTDNACPKSHRIVTMVWNQAISLARRTAPRHVHHPTDDRAKHSPSCAAGQRHKASASASRERYMLKSNAVNLSSSW